MGKTIFNYGLICNGDEEFLKQMKETEKKRKNFFIKFILILSSILTFNTIMLKINTPEVKQKNLYQEIYERTGN